MTVEHQWILGISLLPVVLIRYIPASVAIALTACALSGMSISFGHPGEFGEHMFKFQAISGRALVSLLSVSVLAYLLRWRGLYALPIFFPLLENAAMRGTFLAMALPMIIEKIPLLLVVWIPLILWTKSSTALFLLGLSFAAYFRSLRLFLGSGIACILVGIIMQPWRDLIDSNGRFIVWELSTNWWLEYANIWTGTGLGTFEWFGPLIQHTVGRQELFQWMHSEPLQILFEQGVLGFLAVLGMFAWLLRQARKERWLMASLVVYGGACLTQSPMRNFITALWGALLVNETCSKRS